mgnify:CR=1 FL=1
MKTVVRILSVALLAGVFLGACATTDDNDGGAVAEVDELEFRVIQHENSTLGGGIPDWVTEDEGALEMSSDFEGMYVFKFTETGESLEGVRAIANNMSAPSEIARLINTRVEQKFAGAQVGDQDFVETYFENVVRTLAQAQISGFRKYGDFWVLVEYNDGTREYQYYTLYVMEEERVENLIDEAISGTETETEEETTARERVREIFADGL